MRQKTSDNGRNGATRIVDIAERCGVSVSTVSRALQGDTRQTAETNNRIMRVAKEMGYDPVRSHAARQLISQRFGQRVLHNMIGLWFVKMPTESNYLTSVLRGVLNALTHTDFEVCTCDVGQVQVRRELPLAYRKGIMDGVLTLSAASHADLEVGLLTNEPNFADRPIVGLVERIPNASGVYADNSASGDAAITHLLDLGHKHIAHFEAAIEVERSSTSVHALRYAAYLKALQSRGLDPRPAPLQNALAVR